MTAIKVKEKHMEPSLTKLKRSEKVKKQYKRFAVSSYSESFWSGLSSVEVDNPCCIKYF